MSSVLIATWRRARPRPRPLRLGGPAPAYAFHTGLEHVHLGFSTHLRYVSHDTSAAWTALEEHARQESPKATGNEILKHERALERSNFASSVLVPPVKKIADASSRQNHRIDRVRHKAITRQVLHERRRVESGSRPEDWRQLLEVMVKSTPEESLVYYEDGIRIDFDKDIHTAILNGAGDNSLGAVRKRTGAVIKVSREASAFILSGTRQAVNRATEEFKNIAQKITVTRIYRPLGSGEEAVEKFDGSGGLYIPPLSIDEGLPRKRTRVKQHVDTFPIPKEWTPETLRDHVISLIDSYPDAPLRTTIYPSAPQWKEQVHHQNAVTRRLMRLFSKLGPHVELPSSVAKLALAYMTTKGNIFLDEARALFSILERRGIPMDANIFNILLEAPVKTRDLRKFRQTIFMMTKRGLSPNVDTWILFLRMFESVEVRAYILQAMNAKNMLETPRVIQRIGEEMAEFDAEHAAIQRISLDIFLQQQEDRYGAQWLTRCAGQKVLQVLCQYNHIADASRFYDIMWEHFHNIPDTDTYERSIARPNTMTANILINHVHINGKVPLAVNMVRKMRTIKQATYPSPVTLDLLWQIAWRHRLRTTLTVVWRYAALAGLTSYHMRRQVAKLLRGQSGLGPADRMASTVYLAVGGETLARELVGGRETLEKLRALCRRTWGDDFPWSKLGSLATKMLPRAFPGRSPAVNLGTVLCQSVLTDFKCLRARKINRLRDLLASAKVKSLPLWPQCENRPERRPDLGPADDRDPGSIKLDDKWEEEWDSEGWEERTDDHSFPRVPYTPMRMAIINPKVWDDDPHDVNALAADYRTPLQQQDEQACLKALEELSKDYFSFRYVLMEGHDDD